MSIGIIAFAILTLVFNVLDSVTTELCFRQYPDKQLKGEGNPFMRGLIYRKAKGSLFVAVSNGSILIKEAYDNKGRGIFKNLKVGERFVTPIKYLEDALLFRAVYDSKGLNRQRKNNV